MQHPSSYIKTPNAIAGVKGTEFEVIVDKNENTTFNVIAGVVEVSDINITRTVTLNAGQTSAVPPKGTPTAPKSFDAKSLNRWWETPYSVNAEEIALIHTIISVGCILAFAVILVGILLILKHRRGKAVK
jgi:ferric-dicitrate binding protein FerR (iron transport regulator)